MFNNIAPQQLALDGLSKAPVSRPQQRSSRRRRWTTNLLMERWGNHVLMITPTTGFDGPECMTVGWKRSKSHVNTYVATCSTTLSAKQNASAKRHRDDAYGNVVDVQLHAQELSKSTTLWIDQLRPPIEMQISLQWGQFTLNAIHFSRNSHVKIAVK